MPLPDNRGAFESFLDWLDAPRNAVAAGLTGQFDKAKRSLYDFALDPVDAAIPFWDAIPAQRTGEDKVESGEILGYESGETPWYVEFPLAVATDPLTYAGGALFKGAGKAVSTAGNLAADTADAIVPSRSYGTQAKRGIDRTAAAARSMFGATRPSEEAAQMAGKAMSKGNLTSRVASQAGANLFADVPDDVAKEVVKLMNDLQMKDGKLVAIGVEGKKKFGTLADQMGLVQERAKQAIDNGADPAAVSAAVDTIEKKVFPYFSEQYRQHIKNRVMSLPKGVRPEDDLVPLDYLPRQLVEDDIGTVRSLRERHMTPQQWADYLNANPNAALSGDLANIAGEYGTQAGRGAQAANVGLAILSKSKDPGKQALAKTASLSDDGFKKAVNDEIEAIRKAGDLDSAEALSVAFNGLPPRGAFFKFIAALNGYFKPAATAGYIVPRIAFSTRNVASGLPMVASDPVFADNIGALVKVSRDYILNSPKVLAGGGADWLREVGLGHYMPKSRLDLVDQAIAQSGGRADKALAWLAGQDKGLAKAWELGVIDSGFVSSEQLVKAARGATPQAGASTGQKVLGFKDKALKVANAPSALVRGVEDRMRLGLWESLQRSMNLSPEEAAKLSKRMLYDYQLSSESNRKFRDLVPFGQFLAKSVPQQLGAMTRSGAVGGALRQIPIQAYGADEEDIVYPYMESMANIPLDATDEKGNPLYLSQLGLPFESLATIPNISDDPFAFLQQTQRGVVGSMQPLIKQGAAALIGRDPYFGTPFASYDKPPAVLEAMGMEEGGLARFYNAAAGSGVIQPLASFLNTVGIPFSDDPAWAEAVTGLTGMRIRGVDQDRAEAQHIEDYLRQNPSVQQRTSFYQTGEPDAELADMLSAMRQAKQRAKERREAFELANPEAALP